MMAVIVRSFDATLPRRMTVEIDWAVVQARTVRLARKMVITWIGLNALTWAPSVDAHGNCNCPICHPLSFQVAASRNVTPSTDFAVRDSLAHE